jgi:hypothetical protein
MQRDDVRPPDQRGPESAVLARHLVQVSGIDGKTLGASVQEFIEILKRIKMLPSDRNSLHQGDRAPWNERAPASLFRGLNSPHFALDWIRPNAPDAFPRT